MRKLCKKFLEIFGIRKNWGETLLKLSESGGITKKNCCGNFKKHSKIFEGKCRILKDVKFEGISRIYELKKCVQ